MLADTDLRITRDGSEKCIEIVRNRLAFRWIFVVPKEDRRTRCHRAIEAKIVAVGERGERHMPLVKAILNPVSNKVDVENLVVAGAAVRIGEV